MEELRQRKIVEASYLTAENAGRYRSILRFFYLQHEKLRHYLFPEDVLVHLKEDVYFEEYTEAQLQADLKQLCDWNNLIPRQETGRVLTIEDFKKKRYRYQCTPYTIEIERMVERLHALGESFGGSLEATLFERLLAALRHFSEERGSASGAEFNQTWEDVYACFRKLVEQASDYIAYLKSEKVEECMKSEAFLTYKDAFAEYIRRFILGLQTSSYNIESLLKQITAADMAAAAEKIADYQMSIPRLEEAVERSVYVARCLEQWESLRLWFFGSAGHASELLLLERETMETIRRITRFAQRLGERHSASRSRYQDYLYLAGWFSTLPNVDEAHKLAAALFGSSGVRHICAGVRESEDMDGVIWEEPSTVLPVKPSVNTYREKTRPGAVVNRQAEKEAAREAFLREKEAEQALVDALSADGRNIVLASLGLQPPIVRKTLLNWISRCMGQGDRTAKTENGRLVRLVRRSEAQIVLECTDGTLQLPDFVFEFLD
ncbi:TIGR02677 family protein [Anaeromusa sp.]|uniref:TIGR02677 family protein n=1 Tax=Anaeromusa sp. TaxID=1872520 RepID=UPI00262213A0|nr:TIGR02677 family protein [Anaeromusa sp.]MDD3157323.1 TIGR02677 family protein [Anaeromusa sp.]